MNTRTRPRRLPRLLPVSAHALLRATLFGLTTLVAAPSAPAQTKAPSNQTTTPRPAPTTQATPRQPTAATTPPAAANASARRTPSEVLREFYRAMRERRFRDAFAMSIYGPAVEALSPAEFEELRPDFEEMAEEFPDRPEIGGEQISGDTATVFVKVNEDGTDKLKPTELIRVGQEWIVGGRADQAVVNQRGKQFFFEARIEQHHSVAEDLMKRIAAAELLHSAQNGGRFGDMAALIRGGHVPQEVLTPALTGYQFHLVVQKDGKDYTAGAEPVRYGHTGRLSFYLDPRGLRSKDNGGKPLKK